MIGTFHFRLGDLASWVGSVITGVALIIAFWQLSLLRRDRDARQASLLSMWISGQSLKPNDARTGLDVDLEISFMNVSSQPLGRVLFEVRVGSQKQRGKVGPVPPDGAIHKKQIVLLNLSVDDANTPAEIDIWFTDEAGHRWRRDHTGRLREGVNPPGDWLEIRLKWGIPYKNKIPSDDTDNPPSNET